MAFEIERKYLVKNNAWKTGEKGKQIVQAYLCASPERTVRVRVKGDKAWITIKGKTTGITRTEYEYPIPVNDAQELLTLTEYATIEKHRYEIWHEGVLWEVDEFTGANQGLVLAEVELTSEQQQISLPVWIGKEVSCDRKYYNSSLAKSPYTTWD